MTDNQTPESREDIEQLKESIVMAYRYRNEDDGMTFEEAEADLDRVITAATQAARIEGAKLPIVKYDEATAIAVKKLCEERLAALERQKENL